MKKLTPKEIMAQLRQQDSGELRSRTKEESAKSGSFEKWTMVTPEGIKFYKPKAGKQILDIIGYFVEKTGPIASNMKKGMLWWKASYSVHRNIGPEEKMVVCPQGTLKKKCPICEAYALLKNDPDTEEQAKLLKPSKRELMWVVVDGELMLFDYSWWLFGKKVDVELTDVADDEGLFFNPKDAVSLQVRWVTEKKGNMEATEASSLTFTARKGKLDDEHLAVAMANDPSQFLTILEYDAIKAMFEGNEAVEEEEEDDIPDHRPVKSTKKAKPEPEEDDEEPPPPPKKKAKPAPEPEPEEEEEDDEEPPPPPKKSKAKPAPEPEEEEEEDEAPPPPKKAAKGKDEKAASKGKCPFGHKFGVDCDDEDDCTSCDIWDKCYDTKNA